MFDILKEEVSQNPSNWNYIYKYIYMYMYIYLCIYIYIWITGNMFDTLKEEVLSISIILYCIIHIYIHILYSFIHILYLFFKYYKYMYIFND
jgi:hypothetical protein